MAMFVPQIGGGMTVDELWSHSVTTGATNGIMEALPYTQEEFLALAEKYMFLLFHFDVSPNTDGYNNAYQMTQGYLLIVTSSLRHEYETAVVNNDACEPNYRSAVVQIGGNINAFPKITFNIYPPNFKSYSANRKVYVQAIMSSTYNNGIGTLYLYGIK